MKAYVPSLVAACAALSALLAAPAHSEVGTADEIAECVRKNLPAKSSVQTVKLRAIDRIGSVNESKMQLYWKMHDDGLSRVLLRFDTPPDMHGAGLLMIEKKSSNDMFMYLPELRRVRRVTSHMMSGSMFGTDFTYEQFQRLQGMAQDVQANRLDDGEVNGQAVFVVEQKPAQPTQFDKVLSYVDKQTCVVLKTEYFETGGRLRKLLTVDTDKITEEGDYFIPRSAKMKDLRDETETELVVEEIEVDADIHRKIFTERELATGG